MINFDFIDLFAGIGGIRIPFQRLGGRCVFSSEFDKFCAKVYKDNFGEIPAGDITQIDVKSIPAHDILLGGFPCQPFSMAGLKKGFEDTKGTLFFNIAEILRVHKPETFLLENVKNFKNHDGGKTFQVVKNTLEEQGYKVFTEVLNAKHFGVPQNRERIYIVGFRHNVDFNFPKPSRIETHVGDILEKTVDSKYTISDRLWQGHQRRRLEHKLKGNGFGYCIFDESSTYTSTISARYYKDGSEILIKQNGKNPRKITPREAARLQGFPEDFKITAGDHQSYKQFGNSVAVPVIDAIAKRIVSKLFEIKAKELIDTRHNPQK